MTRRRKNYDSAVHDYQAGLSLEAVAERHGVTRQSMWKILLCRGVTMREQLRYGEENHFYRGGQICDSEVHDQTEYAIARGVLKRQPCEVCGEDGRFADGRSKVHAHHDDYNKPLEIRWLCQSCHHEWHKHNRAIEKGGDANAISGTEEYGLDLLTAGY